MANLDSPPIPNVRDSHLFLPHRNQMAGLGKPGHYVLDGSKKQPLLGLAATHFQSPTARNA